MARISGPVSHTCCSWCTQNTDRNAQAISLLRGHAHWFVVVCHTHTEYFVLTLTLWHHHCKGVLLIVIRCNEVTNFLIPSAGNYFVTIMKDVTITDDI